MKTKSIVPYSLLLLLLAACSPVHRFTRVKKIPREYSLNYCIGEVKAPKTDWSKEPWIVYSDREKNVTLNNAGGKVKAKDPDYLDPFLVLKKKGEYLRLIKYTPDILKNGRLDYKKAEYYGWIHKSKLLLYQQSLTDIADGRKIRMLTLFADTLPLGVPDKYLSVDSMKLYRDPEGNTAAGTVAPYTLVYRLKRSDRENKTLIAGKPYLKPDDIQTDVLGWIDNSLIEDIGTGLHVDVSTLSEDIEETSRFLSSQYKTLQYSPVSSYSIRDSLVAFKTRKVMPLFDYSNNYIFNVNGEQITRNVFRTIVRELKKINITFVFEGQEQTVEQFPQIVNAIQSLQPVFDGDHTVDYRFSCVLAFDDQQSADLAGTDLHPDFSRMTNYLSAKANQKDRLQAVHLPQSWPGLRKAVNRFDQERDAANLIVLIGEKGYAGERADTLLTQKLLQNNIRLCGFQVYAGNDDSYNNFVLAVENMISSYGEGLLKKKKKLLVSPEQVRRNNYYREMDTGKNSFRLDFPDNSITQGFLFFPPKGDFLPIEYMAADIDSLVQQIKNDNNSITQYMAKAFHTFGNSRTVLDSLYVSHFGFTGAPEPSKRLLSKFNRETPGWYLPSKTIVLNDSVNDRLDYYLLLSESEMKELKEFIQSLSAVEVDLKYRAEIGKRKKKACNCPEDDLFQEPQTNLASADTLPPEYASTRNVRKHLYKQYLQTIQYCKPCKEKAGKIKSLTLARAQLRITGCPTSTEVLNRFRLKNLKDKKVLSDKVLDELVNYFKKKLDDLGKAEPFESNGEKYYWLKKNDLP